MNSISEEVDGDILLFADDTKLYKIIDTDEDQLAMQEDINKLHRWSQAWLMTFNKEKCKTMHFGHNNGMQDYVKLSTIKEEKDLGVLITDDLKPSVQCTEAARKAMSALRWSRRNFKYIDSNTFKVLYKTYIRPNNMEFCIQAWSPYMVKDIEVLEKVQHRATRMVPGLKRLPYEDKLRRLDIYSLTARRLRGDLVAYPFSMHTHYILIHCSAWTRLHMYVRSHNYITHTYTTTHTHAYGSIYFDNILIYF